MKVSEKVLNILNAAEVDNGILRVKEQLDRKDYLEVNKVLEAMGGKWSRKDKGHTFSENVEDLLDAMFATGEVTDKKKEFQFYETPKELVKRMIDLAELKKGMFVLEPSAGKGAILNGLFEWEKEIGIMESLNVTANDIQKDFYEVWYEDVECACNFDFLEYDDSDIQEYDRVIMNPPFTKRQDIAHVNHAWKLLKSGGRLVAVMSAGVKFREDKLTKEFRELVEKHGRFEEVPEGTFKTSGTMVNTVLCILDKE